MQREAIEKSMQADLQKLIDCILTDVRVRTFCAEFLLSEAMSITIRIKREFKFALSKSDELRFDPTLTAHDESVESTKFVLLRGMRCRHAVLDRTKFEVDFEGGARLWVDLSEKDFEPLEIIGASGERHEKLEFYYVL